MDIIRDYLESFVNGTEKLKENYITEHLNITEFINNLPGSLISNKLHGNVEFMQHSHEKLFLSGISEIHACFPGMGSSELPEQVHYFIGILKIDHI